jgi:hypothetical protein
MRTALLASLVVLMLSRVTAGQEETWLDWIAPDQFHLFYTRGDGDFAGSFSGAVFGGAYDPYRWETSGDGDYSAITAGFTWNLGRTRSAVAMERAARDLAIAARLLVAAPPSAGETPEETSVPAVQAPDISISVQGGDQAALAAVGAPEASEGLGEAQKPQRAAQTPLDGAQGVELLGVSFEVWRPLIAALGLLTTAVVGYLNRHRIPGVRGMTARGKAEKAECGEVPPDG